MKQITFAERLRYQFDNTMSKGTVALIGWLFILSALMVIICSVIVLLAGLAPNLDENSSLSFGEIIWMSMMRAMDAGTVAGDTGSWSFRFAMLGITIGGIFIVS